MTYDTDDPTRSHDPLRCFVRRLRRARHFHPRNSLELAARVIGTSRRIERVERVCGEGEHPRFFSCRSPGCKIHPRGPHSLFRAKRRANRSTESNARGGLPRDHQRARRKSPRGFSRPRERFRERVAPEAYRLPGRGVRTLVRLGAVAMANYSPLDFGNCRVGPLGRGRSSPSSR